MSSESTSQPQVTEISAESGEQILSLLQVQGEEGSGHETIQLVTTSGDGEGIDGQETLLLQPAIEVNGERHVILQQAQDPNTGEVLVFLQGENGETVCLPPEALNANIVQMGDGSGQVYTLALPSDADGSSVVVVSETAEGVEGGGSATLITDETLGNVITATTSAGTMDIAGSIETIVTSGDTFNIDQLAGEAALLASSSTSGTQVVQSVVGPLMATTVTSETSSTEEEATGTRTDSNEDAASTKVTTSTTPTTTKTTTTAETIATQSITKETDSKVENEISTNSEGGTLSVETQKVSVSVPTDVTSSSSSSSSAAAAAAAAAKIVEEMNSIDVINSKLNEAVSKLGEEKDLDKCEEEVDPNNMNYGSAVIQVQDANSTTSLDSLMANAMLAAGESNYVIMTTGEDGELPKEINLADVINAGSASGQTIFLQTSEGLVACQAATTGEDGSLQIVADGSGNAIAVSSNSNTTNSSFSEATSGQTLAYTLSSTSSGIELTPVSNMVSSTPNVSSSSSSSSSTNRNNQVTSVSSSRSRFSRQTKPRINLPTSNLTSSSSSSSSASSSLTSSSSLVAAATTTIGETLLLPSKHLVSSLSLNHTSNSSGSGFMINSNNLNTNSRRRTLPNRGGVGRSNISVSITPSSGTSSLSTNSSSPIIPVQPDAIHSSSSDFSTLKSSSETATDSSLLTEGISRPSQLAASRRTYSKKNNIVWLNPETTAVAKRFAAATSSSNITTSTTSTNNNTNTTTNNNSNSNLKDGKDEGGESGGKEKETAKIIDTNNDCKMIDLPVETMNDISLTTTTTSGNSPTSSPLSATTPSSSTSFTSSKLTVKPPTTLTVSNVPTLRSTKRVAEPPIKSSATTSSSVTPLSPSKSASTTSGMVNKDYSRVISTNVDKVSSPPGVVPSMIKVAAVPQLGRVVTQPGKVTSPVKPNSPVKVTSPTTTTTTTTSNLKVTSPTKVGSPTKIQHNVESNSDFDLDFGASDDGGRGGGGEGGEGGEGAGGEGGEKVVDVVLSPSRSPSRRVTSPIKPSIISERNRLNSKDGSESDSEPIVRKPIDFDALIAATNPLNKIQGKGNQQSTTKQNDFSESLKKSTESDAPKTRSGRKRLSESESGSDQVMISEDDVKTSSHIESGVPSKKRVNFALADSGDNELIVESVSTKDGTELETPNTRSRKRKADIETITDLSDQSVTDKDVLSLSTAIGSPAPTTPSTTTVACTPPPKKRANFVLAQSNDENDLFVTPLSPVKSPKRDDQQLKGSPSATVTPTIGGGQGGEGEDNLGSIVDTPISEARSTRSSRKRRADSEAETASSADEGVSSMREESLSSATPVKKRVNFALGTTIEVIGGDDEDEDGDDDDSDSVDEKRKEKRLSMRRRTPVHRPLLSSMESPQPILKVHKRAVESSPVLLHFGSDSNDDGGESEGGGGGGGVGEGEGRGISEVEIMKGLVESRGPSEFFDFTINGCCFHIRHQSGRLTPFLPNESEGNYACMNNCGYRTSRMNNIILHNKDQCTVIKMQWQSEIQHLINRQRFTNQDESDSVTPITSPKPSKPTTSTLSFTDPTTDSNSMDIDTDPIVPMVSIAPTEATEPAEATDPVEVTETLQSESPLSPTKSTTLTQDHYSEEKEVATSPNPSSSSSPPHEPSATTSLETETPKEEEKEATDPTETPEAFEKESIPEATEPTEPSESIDPSESTELTESSEPCEPSGSSAPTEAIE